MNVAQSSQLPSLPAPAEGLAAAADADSDLLIDGIEVSYIDVEEIELV
jgi:hypothetical protein